MKEYQFLCLILSVVLILLGFHYLYKGFVWLRMKHHARETKTSLVEDCKLGEDVEIKGRIALTGPQTIAPISNKHCVFYIWNIEIQSGDRGENWKYVGTFFSDSFLILEDSNAGKVILDPRFLNLEIWKNKKSACTIEWSGKNKAIMDMRKKHPFLEESIFDSSILDYRVTEYVFEAEKECYLLGKIFAFENHTKLKVDKDRSLYSYFSNEVIDYSKIDLLKDIDASIVPPNYYLQFYGNLKDDDKVLFSDLSENEIQKEKSKKAFYSFLIGLVLIASATYFFIAVMMNS